MAGIASCGAYVPILRLSQSAISQAWGGAAGQGERAVANFDEDSITMAVEAARDCLQGLDRSQIGALFFASTTPPYAEKQCAALIATVLDLDRNVTTIDFTGSTRAATIALKAAMDTVKAGSAKQVLVVAADCRTGVPESEWEKLSGDGAAALLITGASGGVSIEDCFAFSDEFTFNWRKADDAFIRGWEERFIMTEGYQAAMSQAVTSVLKNARLASKDISAAVLYGPNARQHAALVKAVKFDPKAQVKGSSLFDTVGNTGAAFALMMLTTALEAAKSGERILVANYGDGADACILKVEQPLDCKSSRRGLTKFLSPKIVLPNYQEYLALRKLVKGVPEGSPGASLVAIWRERKSTFACYGIKCRKCGVEQYPIQRVCGECQAKDDFELVPLADKKGILFTFTKEIGGGVEYPKVWSVLELEGGCRFFTALTDRDPDKLDAGSMGMPVEMTFRRLSEGSGFHNYIWKGRPAR